MSGAPEKRQRVRELTAAGLCQRRACRIVGASRSPVAYKARSRDEEAVVAAINALRQAKPRWGNKRAHACLRRDGLLVNRKRIERLWHELGYTLPARRPRKKLRIGDHVPIAAAHPNHVWIYDFIFDATAGGRRLKIVSVLDEFTREA
jgi:putative transposase